MAQVKSGTFTGSGTTSEQLQIGFEPDVLIVESDVDYTVSGWTGIGHIAIAKGIVSVVMRHNNSTVSQVVNNTYPLTTTGTAYGDAETAQSYCVYGTYADGVMTLANQQRSGVGVTFNSDRQYKWTAYKA